MSEPALSAVLVVRDEAANLPACLASLRGVVDEVVVHDTGSVDGTIGIATAAGATVLEGHWDDDFARARNVGLDLARAPWVLVLDADERVVAHPGPDPERLARLLATTSADVLTVTVDNAYPEEFGGRYRHPGPRLLRRSQVRYTGRVHEQPVSGRGGATASCPADVLTLDHLGYAAADVVRAKAARNANIAGDELDRLRSDPDADPAALGKVLLDLGRSLVVCGRLQEAVDAFETLRELAPGSRRALEATDALARVLLGGGLDDAVLVLAEQLRDGGADGRYCDWLRAQALAHLGDAPTALGLLRTIDVLRDSAGRELDLGQVHEIRALVASLAGDDDDAVASLVVAMTRHGRVRGRGPLLLDLWGDRPSSRLADLLASGCANLPDRASRAAGLAVELAGCRPPGPSLAAGLRSMPVLTGA